MRKLLTNGMWSKLEALLPSERGRKSRPSKDNRLMLEGMLWKMRTGSPWRDLPPEFGPWMSVYTRFNRWCQQGVLSKVLDALRKSSVLPTF
jgi:transposase